MLTAASTADAPLGEPNKETQLRLSDGLYVFEADALADGVTVEYLDYDNISFDAGFKYRGWSFQSEYYQRKLFDFVADGPLPLSTITDRGIQAQLGYMIVPHHVLLYTSGGYVWDQFSGIRTRSRPASAGTRWAHGAGV